MNEKRPSTDPLDDAMRELIDICQQYNDNLKAQRQLAHQTSKDKIEKGFKTPEESANLTDASSRVTRNHAAPLIRNCDINKQSDNLIKEINHSPTQSMEANNLVERLQQRQSEIQKQLDEVLATAKSLESKRKRKQNNILNENHTRVSVTCGNSCLDDEDDELIEFQQIENELRVTELNRQLSNVHEELRLTLYNQLLTNTRSSSKSSQTTDNRQNSSDTQGPSARRNSAQTDESTPSSSSCSDEQTAFSSNASTSVDLATPRPQQQQNSISATSSNNSFDLASHFNERLNIGLPLDSQQQLQLTISNTGEFYTAERESINDTNSDVSSIKSNSRSKSGQANPQLGGNGVQTDIDFVLEQMNNYEVTIPSTSRAKPPQYEAQVGGDESAVQSELTPGLNNYYQVPGSLFAGSYRVANKDLERIDEGDEDDHDQYCNSDKLRTIYEEKLSPLLRAGELERNFQPHRFNEPPKIDTNTQKIPKLKPLFQNQSTGDPIIQTSGSGSQSLESKIQESSPDVASYNRFNPDNVNSAKRANRPLTMYLPKPDEEINLLEHIQALGHDISMVLSDIKLSPSSACGYLYKACSNNPKKWLKRFFHFDRNLKSLCYYETEEQAIKRNHPPKNSITFSEIRDVYVDHSLSNVNEKHKASKKSNFVFVLTTTRRKFTLSTPRAETMRTWIDVLFTAAKADDYFQELDNNVEAIDEDNEAHYSSLVID